MKIHSWKMRRVRQGSLSSAELCSCVDSLSLLCSRARSCRHLYGDKRQRREDPMNKVKSSEDDPRSPCRMPPVSLRSFTTICKCERPLLPCACYTISGETQVHFGSSQGHLTKVRTRSPAGPHGKGWGGSHKSPEFCTRNAVLFLADTPTSSPP